MLSFSKERLKTSRYLRILWMSLCRIASSTFRLIRTEYSERLTAFSNLAADLRFPMSSCAVKCHQRFGRASNCGLAAWRVHYPKMNTGRNSRLPVSYPWTSNPRGFTSCRTLGNSFGRAGSMPKRLLRKCKGNSSAHSSERKNRFATRATIRRVASSDGDAPTVQRPFFVHWQLCSVNHGRGTFEQEGVS